MNELDLYKFVTLNELQFSCRKIDGKREVYLEMPFYLLEDFAKLYWVNDECEEPINVQLSDEQISIDMHKLCEQDVLKRVFGEEMK